MIMLILPQIVSAEETTKFLEENLTDDEKLKLRLGLGLDLRLKFGLRLR
jgi:hypothetical protein